MKHRPEQNANRRKSVHREAKTSLPRVALFGAGDRGTVYTDWIALHQGAALRKRDSTRGGGRPGKTGLRLVAVAEPDGTRRARVAARHGLDESKTFTDWQTLFDRVPPQDLDAVIVATGDREHVEPACAALERGHHILLEKPMATDAQGLRRLRAAERDSPGGSITVCHVLRHSEVFRTVKRCIDAGEIGEVLTMYHAENVAYYHMAHSYVRGRWRNSAESSPMILAKSCHDLDLMCWFAGTSAETSTTEHRSGPAG
ncbi:MAG: Gfo/Idh/MocA family protein, partial [Spirochaetales bacterium]